MPKYILQELPGEMTDGKKIVYPKMQTYSLKDYETVIDHMRDYAGSLMTVTGCNAALICCGEAPLAASVDCPTAAEPSEPMVFMSFIAIEPAVIHVIV